MKASDIIKAFGKKNIAKLIKKQILDKRGKRTTVYTLPAIQPAYKLTPVQIERRQYFKRLITDPIYERKYFERVHNAYSDVSDRVMNYLNSKGVRTDTAENFARDIHKLIHDKDETRYNDILNTLHEHSDPMTRGNDKYWGNASFIRDILWLYSNRKNANSSNAIKTGRLYATDFNIRDEGIEATILQNLIYKKSYPKKESPTEWSKVLIPFNEAAEFISNTFGEENAQADEAIKRLITNDKYRTWYGQNSRQIQSIRRKFNDEMDINMLTEQDVSYYNDRADAIELNDHYAGKVYNAFKMIQNHFDMKGAREKLKADNQIDIPQLKLKITGMKGTLGGFYSPPDRSISIAPWYPWAIVHEVAHYLYDICPKHGYPASSFFGDFNDWCDESGFHARMDEAKKSELTQSEIYEILEKTIHGALTKYVDMIYKYHELPNPPIAYKNLSAFDIGTLADYAITMSSVIKKSIMKGEIENATTISKFPGLTIKGMYDKIFGSDTDRQEIINQVVAISATGDDTYPKRITDLVNDYVSVANKMRDNYIEAGINDVAVIEDSVKDFLTGDLEYGETEAAAELYSTKERRGEELQQRFSEYYSIQTEKFARAFEKFIETKARTNKDEYSTWLMNNLIGGNLDAKIYPTSEMFADGKFENIVKKYFGDDIVKALLGSGTMSIFDFFKAKRGRPRKTRTGRKGKKDIAKLIKKQVVDKRGKLTTVYVKVGKGGYQKSKILDFLARLFGVSAEQAHAVPAHEYFKLNVKTQFNSSPDRWDKHFVEYFHKKSKWDAHFEQKKKAPAPLSTKDVGKLSFTRRKRGGTKLNEYNQSMMQFLHNTYKNLGGEHGKGDVDHRPGVVPSGEPVRTGGLEERIDTSGGVSQGRTDREESHNDVKPVGERLGRGKRVGKRGIIEAREKIKQLLATKRDDEMTDADRELLRQYEGAGGLGEEGATAKGILYEYYTPETVINKLWTLVNKYTADRKGLDVLEPSAGIGRFADGEGAQHKVDMVEIDETSARINRILHPKNEIKRGSFEELFLDKLGNPQKQYTGKQYDAVVGNPPYGQYKSRYKGRGEGKEIGRFEEYFVHRGLDTLKPGGVMAYVLPSGFLKDVDDKVRRSILSKGRIMEAWRLPNGTFSTTGVGTDVVIFRKEPETRPELWSNDKYFEEHPDHILGNQSSRTGRFGRQEDYVSLKEGQTFDDAINSININKVNVPPVHGHTMTEEAKEKISAAMIGNDNAAKPHKTEKKRTYKGKSTENKNITVTKSADGYTVYKKTQGDYSFDEFSKKYGKQFTEQDYSLWLATEWDGSLNLSKAKGVKIDKAFIEKNLCIDPDTKKIFHPYNYLQGNLYDKFTALEMKKDEFIKEYGKGMYDKQMRLIADALPPRRTVDKIALNPIAPIVRDFTFIKEDEDEDQIPTLISKFYEWAGVGSSYYGNAFQGAVSQHDLKGISWSDVTDYIERRPLRGERASSSDTAQEKAAKKERNDITKDKRREVAYTLFNRFLQEGLTKSEQKQVEDAYNRQFNANATIDYSKFPFFVKGLSKEFKGSDLEITPVQLEGASFLCNRGVGLLGYGTGVGKTMTGTLATVYQMQSGQCKRPVIIVPKNAYTKWLSEIHDLFPNLKINALGNLGEKYYNHKSSKIEDGTLTVLTHQALETLTLKDENVNKFMQDLTDVIADPSKDKRGKAQEGEKVEQEAGRAEKVRRNRYYFEDFGFDHITVDEAHNFKNLFGGAKTESEKVTETKGRYWHRREVEKNVKVSNEYGQITGGTSDRAAKLYLISNYVQDKNNGRNVFLMTATPFQNSPLEIYNMLSFMAKKKLEELGIKNLNTFMSHFVQLKREWVSSAKGKIEKKDVVKEFKDLAGLQNLIKQYIDFRSSKEARILTPTEKEMTVELAITPEINEIHKAMQRVFSDPKAMRSGQGLAAIGAMRMATLSPAFTGHAKNEDDESDSDAIDETRENVEVVDSSPKLTFTCKTVAELYRAKPDVGSIIYMPRGINKYGDVVDYLVKQGVPRDSIGEIHSKVPVSKRDKITESFNDPKGKIKVIIGSDTIKEAIDLNGNSAFLFNTFLPWNPNDNTQLRGRLTRQGNNQAKTFVVYPIMSDTIDSVMYQKHDEKQARFGEVWNYKGDSLDVSPISPEDLKFDLIKDPEVKAAFKVQLLTEAARDEKGENAARAEYFNNYHKKYTNATEQMKGYDSRIREQEKDYNEAKAEYEHFKSVVEAEKNPDDMKKRELRHKEDKMNYELKYLRDAKKDKTKAVEELEKIKQAFFKYNVNPDKVDENGHLPIVNEYVRKVEAADEKIKKIEGQKQMFIDEAKLEIAKNAKKLPVLSDTIKNTVNYLLAQSREWHPGEKEQLTAQLRMQKAKTFRMGDMVFAAVIRNEKQRLIKARLQ